jgi:hypothetical protein
MVVDVKAQNYFRLRKFVTAFRRPMFEAVHGLDVAKRAACGRPANGLSN